MIVQNTGRLSHFRHQYTKTKNIHTTKKLDTQVEVFYAAILEHTIVIQH